MSHSLLRLCATLHFKFLNMPTRPRRRLPRRAKRAAPFFRGLPQEFDAGITCRKRLVYGVQGNSCPAVVTITGRDLMQLLVSCQVASSTVSTAVWTSHVAAYKLHRVTVWPLETVSAGAGNFVTISWPHTSTSGGLGQPVRRMVRPILASPAASMVASVPQFVTSTPPPGSYQSFWQDSSSVAEGIFQIQTSTAGVSFFVEIDITLSLAVGTSAAACVFGATVLTSTPTAGQLMYAPINSSSATGLTSAVPFVGFADTYVNQFWIDA